MITSEYDNVTVLRNLISSLNDQIYRVDHMRDGLTAMRDQYQEQIFDIQEQEFKKWLMN